MFYINQLPRSSKLIYRYKAFLKSKVEKKPDLIEKNESHF